MKYFEKLAFDPKSLIGPTIGATAFGLSGYAGAEPGKEWTAGIGSAMVGGVVGAGVQAWARKLKESGKALKSIMSEQGGGSTEAVLQKSREVMEALEKQQAKIKSHVTTKSKFKYKEALKMTKEKRAAFFEKTEKDLTNKDLQKELRKGYFAGGLGQTASGGIMGAYAQSFLGKVGKRPWKGLAVGAAAGLALTPVSNILEKKDILKEVDRRKKHPGYK